MEENIPYIEPDPEVTSDIQDEHGEIPMMETEDREQQEEDEETPFPEPRYHQPMEQEQVPAQLYYPNDIAPRGNDREVIPGQQRVEPPRHQHHQQDDHQDEQEEVPQFVPEPRVHLMWK